MKIAIIGDVHGFWDEVDTEYFNSSDYDFILFTGDLRSYTEREDKVAKRISSGLTRKAFLIPGNTDTTNLFQAAGEIFRNQYLVQGFYKNQEKKLVRMKESLGKITLSSYQSHQLSNKDISISLIVLRPFAMGVNLSYAPTLKKIFGVTSLEDSSEKYKQLINSIQEKYILFLGHNGPSGLGSDSNSLWSSDFTKDPLDWGDIDYRFAIDYAKSIGKVVLASIAGHMHHRLKENKGERNWLQYKEGIHYINAAKVPRIFKKDGRTFHHHIQIHISDEMSVTVKEILI